MSYLSVWRTDFSYLTGLAAKRSLKHIGHFLDTKTKFYMYSPWHLLGFTPFSNTSGPNTEPGFGNLGPKPLHFFNFHPTLQFKPSTLIHYFSPFQPNFHFQSVPLSFKKNCYQELAMTFSLSSSPQSLGCVTDKEFYKNTC